MGTVHTFPIVPMIELAQIALQYESLRAREHDIRDRAPSTSFSVAIRAVGAAIASLRKHALENSGRMSRRELQSLIDADSAATRIGARVGEDATGIDLTGYDPKFPVYAESKEGKVEFRITGISLRGHDRPVEAVLSLSDLYDALQILRNAFGALEQGEEARTA